ncbi:MAG: hypothetical protein U5J83_02055 [Bryobacterales bacterium]|nr:hypothetical protein [Bryobacterales bacterium]
MRAFPLLGGVESELNSNRIEEMGSAIIEGKGLEGALWKLADGWGAGVGAGDELSELTAGIAWDEDYCVFRINCKLTQPVTPAEALDGPRLHTKYEGALKIGLSEAGWALLIGRVATRLPVTTRFAQALNGFFQPLRNRLAASLANLGLAATPRLGGFLGSLGASCNIWMWAITLGFAVRDLSVWICRRSWEAGVRRGRCVTYSNAACDHRRLPAHLRKLCATYRDVQTRAQSHARAII